MTPSLKSDSTLEDSLNLSQVNTTYKDTQQHDKLVPGPNGNTILCDSPAPSSELPIYAGPEECIKQKKPTTRRSISIERAKPRRVIGNFTLINTLGSGSMGKVRLAVHNITGEKVRIYIYMFILKKNQ